MIEVCFELNQEDLKALEHYCEHESPASVRRRLIAQLLYIGIGAGVAFVVSSGLLARIGVFLLAWFVLFYFVRSIIRIAERFSDTSSVRPGVLCEHRVKLTEEGIFEITPVDASCYKWPLVSFLHITPQHVFICVPSGTHIIPQRAFNDEAHASDFIGLATAYFETSRSSP